MASRTRRDLGRGQRIEGVGGRHWGGAAGVMRVYDAFRGHSITNVNLCSLNRVRKMLCRARSNLQTVVICRLSFPPMRQADRLATVLDELSARRERQRLRALGSVRGVGRDGPPRPAAAPGATAGRPRPRRRGRSGRPLRAAASLQGRAQPGGEAAHRRRGGSSWSPTARRSGSPAERRRRASPGR